MQDERKDRGAQKLRAARGWAVIWPPWGLVRTTVGPVDATEAEYEVDDPL